MMIPSRIVQVELSAAIDSKWRQATTSDKASAWEVFGPQGPQQGGLLRPSSLGVWGFGRMTGFSGVGLRVPEWFGNYEEFMGFGFYCGFRVEGWVVWVLE